MFSLMSQRLGSKNRAEQTPPLVRLISASGLSPFIYVLEKIVRPLVHALSYLLFEEGLSVECHSQNILYELDGASELTGKVILRDLTGVRVQIGLRFARGKPFPRCGWFPPHARQIEPLFMGRTVRRSASFFVENFGLRCALWPLTYGLRRYFPSLSYAALKSAYLLLWQEAAVASLHLRPLFKPRRAGLALDEAIDFYLANFPWDALAREHRGSLSSRDLVPLTFAPVRRGRGRIGGRGIAMSWGTIVPGANGSLYLCDRSAGRA
jgi:hypothetical protein